jgi:hypothetical protein
MGTFKQLIEHAYGIGPDTGNGRTQFMAGARAVLEIAAEQLERSAGKYIGEPHADESIAREACWYALTLRALAKEIV